MELGVTAVMLPELDFEQQIQLCQSLGIRYYQYRPRVIAPQDRGAPYSNWGNHRFDLTPERLLAEGPELTRRLRDAGLEPWGTLPTTAADSPEDLLKLNLEGAARAGARAMRCAPPPYQHLIFNYAAYLDQTVDLYAGIIERLSRPLGIKLLIETHTGSAASAPGLAWNLCRPFAPTDLGIIFDVANFAREGEANPTLSVSVLQDYIDCVHIGGGRRVDDGRDSRGCRRIRFEACALEDSDLYVPAWVAALRDAHLQAPLIIEDFQQGLTGSDRLTRSAMFLHRLQDRWEEI